MRGRRSEWAAVLKLLRTVSSAHQSVTLVEGEPGIGKSLLLLEAASVASARGIAVAAGRADQLGRLMPLGPLLSALEESPAPIITARHTFPFPEGSGLLLWLAEQVQTSLKERTDSGPLLVTLDDLQWADPATLMALRTLPARLASRPVSWLLARRTAPGHDDADRLFDLLEEEGATRILLHPLDDGAVAELSADVLGAPAGEELAVLAAQAGGNPLLLSELLTGLREENCVRVEGGVARLTGSALPRRVHTAVRRRLDELGTKTRHLLEATAVLGRSFSPTYAAELLGETPTALLPALREALAAGVLVATADELVFRHELLWRSVVERVPRRYGRRCTTRSSTTRPPARPPRTGVPAAPAAPRPGLRWTCPCWPGTRAGSRTLSIWPVKPWNDRPTDAAPSRGPSWRRCWPISGSSTRRRRRRRAPRRRRWDSPCGPPGSPSSAPGWPSPRAGSTARSSGPRPA